MKLIGQAVLRKEGNSKVTGKALYVDDLQPEGLLYGVTVRSPVPRGIIENIRFADGIPWDEMTIVTADDIPGQNHVMLLGTDQPLLASKSVNHAEEPVLLLAHADKYLLEEARRAVELEIAPLPALFTIDEALAQTAVIWGEDNVFKRFLVEKGDIDPAFANADFVVEGEYRTGAQEQLYIETNGMLAIANRSDGVTIWGSLQCPYYVHKALLPVFDLPPEKIRIIQCETGGGFGGKEEYPNMLAGHAALLALKSGRPVKMIYDRAEDMAATTKRHPSLTKHRTAVRKDGKILAMDIEFYLDGGAYMTLSPVVLSRGTIHAAGPYCIDNVRIRAAALATNLPPHGAFRGFGAPQSVFATERHMDKIAKVVGLSPEELRRRNFLKPGDSTATSQVISEAVDMQGLLTQALTAANYHEKRQRFAEENAHSPIKKGIGFATFMHGAGFTGSGEKNLRSIVGLEINGNEKVRVLAASTEIGQGTNTIFSQIAADALGLGYDDIEVAQPDTANVPNSGPTVASRTCMVVGKLVESAALALKQTLQQSGLLQTPYSRREFLQACQQYVEANGPLKTFSEYTPPKNIQWNDDTYKGDAYATYAWAVYVAEVSVDTRTYETRVDDFVALQEVGKVIHPVLATGQIEGGVAQAIGFAIYEKVVWQNGSMANNRMTNYIMPTSVDLPAIRVFFAEQGNAFGPGGGAKGIGELPMDGGAPAILNAMENALNVAPNEAPCLPEDLLQLLEAS